MLRKNFPGRKNQRRKDALARLEAGTKTPSRKDSVFRRSEEEKRAEIETLKGRVS